MYHYEIELRAANPKHPFKFSKTEVEHIKQAINTCNNSSNFKTYQKSVAIKGFYKEYILIELASRTPLEKPVLSLRGISRYLTATGEFEEYLFRGSLFNGIVKESTDDDRKELSEVETMQEIIRILFGTDIYDKQMKKKIISMISEYRHNRM